MEDLVLYASLSLFFLVLVRRLLFSSKNYHKKNLPPSPLSLPILGHLYLVKPPPHRSLRKLSEKYGPVMSLKFGSCPVVVVSSPEVAEECFTKNDIVLANRPKLTLGKYLGYNYNTIAMAPYGDHWRNLRRIGAIEIFSGHRLNMFVNVRKDEVKRLLCELGQDSRQDFAKVELRPMFASLTFNIMMRMVSGKRYYGDDVTNAEEAEEFRDLTGQLIRYAGAANPEDFLPIWKWLNGSRFEKNIKELAGKVDQFLQRLIDEHRKNKENGVESNTMIDHLLSLQETDQADYYNDETIKGLIVVMLLAGTDTSAVALEWAMCNLINHPEILNKAKKELDTQIGQERLVEELDLSKLQYLQNIISETLRLHPAGPLLVPHFSSADCTIGGYHVPRETMVLVNLWAIQTDPNLWEDPTSFKPERFEKEQPESYKYFPFGAGRRACPGGSMAQRVVGLTLASLIQGFDWKRCGDGLIDMTEGGKRGGMRKAQQWHAQCKARDVIKNVLADA